MSVDRQQHQGGCHHHQEGHTITKKVTTIYEEIVTITKGVANTTRSDPWIHFLPSLGSPCSFSPLPRAMAAGALRALLSPTFRAIAARSTYFVNSRSTCVSKMPKASQASQASQALFLMRSLKHEVLSFAC